MRLRTAIATALCIASVSPARAQAPRDMGPYLMADRSAEIALARTAAPRHVSDSATVLVFTRNRFVEAAHGTNGFTCVVLRSFSGPIDDPDFWNPRIRAPHCFNPPASRTVLPRILKEAERLVSGVSPREVMAQSQRDYASHRFPSPAAGAMTYMLSKEQYLQEVNPHAAPHLMFYYDKAMPPALWGADPTASPVIADADPHARILTLFIPVRRWSDGTPAMASSPAAAAPASGSDAARSSPIVELRQYTLHPGRRDDLIRLFDAEFVEPQEKAGIKVIGQFRNLDDPNKFVWLRGFPDMVSRKQSLGDFYTGKEWRSRRNDANATIIDNDNVLLLRPVHADAAFDLQGLQRQPIGSTSATSALIVATIYHLDPTPEKERDFVKFFDATMTPLLQSVGTPVIGAFVSEQSANTFPGLPVREREPVFVWFSRYKDASAYEHALAALAATPAWRDSLSAELSSRVREPFTLRLSPTERSILR